MIRVRPFPAAAPRIASAAAVFLLLLCGCNGPASSPPEAPAPPPPVANAPRAAADPRAALRERGGAIYHSVCIACHNSDPKKSGSLGPDVWGASLELLTARVMKAEYPPGYKPKRATHVMQPLPQVAKDLPAIHAYLNGE